MRDEVRLEWGDETSRRPQPVVLTFESLPQSTSATITLKNDGSDNLTATATPCTYVERASHSTSDGAAATYVIGYRKRGESTLTLAPVPPPRPMVLASVARKGGERPRPVPPTAIEAPKRAALVEELGAEKSRKRLKAARLKQVKSTSVINGSNLGAKLTDAIMAAQPAPSTASPQEQRPQHPLFVLGATTAAEAFPRNGLVPPTLFSELNVSAMAAAASSPEQLQTMSKQELATWPAWVLERLREVPALSSDEMRHERLICLAYLTFLIRFLAIDGKIWLPSLDNLPLAQQPPHEIATRLKIPPVAWTVLCELYSAEVAPGKAQEGNKQRMHRVTDTLREKGIMHALALALRIAGGTIPHEALMRPLRLVPKKNTFYLKQLGCKLQKREAGKMAELTSPLELPKIEARIVPAKAR